MPDNIRIGNTDLAAEWQDFYQKRKKGIPASASDIGAEPVPTVEGTGTYFATSPVGEGRGRLYDVAIGVRGAASRAFEGVAGMMETIESGAKKLSEWTGLPEGSSATFLKDYFEKAAAKTAPTEDELQAAHPDVYGAVLRGIGSAAIDLPKFALTSHALRLAGLGHLAPVAGFGAWGAAEEHQQGAEEVLKGGLRGAGMGALYETLGLLALPSRLLTMGGAGATEAILQGQPLHEIVGSGLVGAGLGLMGGPGGVPLKEAPGRAAKAIKGGVQSMRAPKVGVKPPADLPPEEAAAQASRVEAEADAARKEAATRAYASTLEDQRRAAELENQRLMEDWDRKRAEDRSWSGVDEIPWDESAIARQASDAGVQYVGLMEGRIPIFRDPATGATFGAGPFESVPNALMRSRERSDIITERFPISEETITPEGTVVPRGAPPSTESAPNRRFDTAIGTPELRNTAARAERAFPGGRVSVRNDSREIRTTSGERMVLGDRVEVDLPNGQRVTVLPDQSIAIDASAFRRQQGRDPVAGEYIEGEFSTLVLKKESLIRLAREGWGQDTIDHETFHAAMSLVLTPKEHGAILRDHLGAVGPEALPAARALVDRLERGETLSPAQWDLLSAAEEAAAESYGKYSQWRRGFADRHPVLDKIRWFFRKVFDAVEGPSTLGTLERIRRGEVWKRVEQGEAYAEPDLAKATGASFRTMKPPKEFPEEFNGWKYDGVWEGTNVRQYTDHDPNSPTFKNTVAVKAPEDLPGKIAALRKEYDLAKKYRVGSRPSRVVNLEPASEEQLKTWTAMDPKDLVVEGKGVGINFDKLNTTDDVKAVFAQVVKLNENWSKDLGGKKSLVEMARDAERVGFSAEDLLNRQEGQALNHAELLAAKQISLASARLLTDLNAEYRRTGSEAAKNALSKQIAIHEALQLQFGQARREASWALNTLRNEVAGDMKYLQGLESVFERMGGRMDVDRFSEMIATLPTPEQVARFVAQSQRARTSDVLLEIWINSLLSGPQTHAANILSNSVATIMGVAERFVAGRNPFKKSSLPDQPSSVVPGEAGAMISGLSNGFLDALRAAWKMGKTGESAFSGEKIDLAKKTAVKADTFSVGGDSTLGRAINGIGELIRTPGKALLVADEFFKLVNYRMELNAQAFRQAYTEGARGEALNQRISEILMNPPEVVSEAAKDFALYQTFTNELGPMGQSFLRFTRSHPAMRLVLPFVQTPTNIMKYTFERAPGINLLSKQFRDDLSSGGARRDLAFAKLALGSVTLAAVTGLAASGVITGGGPSDENLKKIMKGNGWQPYSVRVGDEYISFNRLDPLGALFGFAADLHDILGNVDDVTFGKAVMGSVLALSNAMLSKTYLTGLASAIDAINEPDKKIDTAFRRLGSSWVPALVAQLNRSTFDTTLHESFGLLDDIKAKIPGMSADLPPRRNLWGEAIYYEGGLGPDFVSPIYTMKDKADPVSEEMIAQGVSVPMPSKVLFGRKPAGETDLRNESVKDGVRLTPNEYDRLVVLAGEKAHDELSKFINSAEYQKLTDGPDGSKAMVIKTIVGRYREAARVQLLEEFPELKDAFVQKLNERAIALGGR